LDDRIRELHHLRRARRLPKLLLVVARLHAVVHCLGLRDRRNGFSTHIPRGASRALFRRTGLHNIVR